MRSGQIFWRHALLSTVISLAAIAGGPCRANDSSMGLVNGALVFERNADIELREERLYISAKTIQVGYRFFNRSGHPVETEIGFPLPDLHIDYPDQNVNVPQVTYGNPFCFSVAVDGRPVAAALDVRVFGTDGRDHTDVVRRLGSPVLPFKAPWPVSNNFEKAERADADELIRLGLRSWASVVTSDGHVEHYLFGIAHLHATYHWRQIFPPRREIVIAHRYTPSVATATATRVAFDFDEAAEPVPADSSERASHDEAVADLARYRQRYCVSDDFIRRVRSTGLQDRISFQERQIEYVLKTGANWAGPIREFRLIVDKGKPENLISLCENMRQIGPTLYEADKRNFSPDHDLAILILNSWKDIYPGPND